MKYLYRPLPPVCKLLKDEEYILCAAEYIIEGTPLGITHVVDQNYPGGKITTPLGGFISHSSDPNAVLITYDRLWQLWTEKDIMPNHPITIDKTKYELPYNVINLEEDD